METFSRLDSVLLLSSVNLPGGELVKNTFLNSWLCCSVFPHKFPPLQWNIGTPWIHVHIYNREPIYNEIPSQGTLIFSLEPAKFECLFHYRGDVLLKMN